MIYQKIDKDENWLSCEELETIEKRFTDLLQNTTYKKPYLIINNMNNELIVVID